MKKINYLQVLLIVALLLRNGFAQNLIMNGDFELGAIPNAWFQVNYANGWSNGCAKYKINNTTITPGTPDLFDTRSPNCEYKIPQNKWANRNVRTYGSNRYVGFSSTHGNIDGGILHGESVMGTLTQALTADCQYEISLWTSAIDWYVVTCPTSHTLQVPSPVNKVEVLLRKSNDNCTAQKFIYLSGQVTHQAWQNFEGTFTLTPAEAAMGFDRIEFRLSNNWTPGDPGTGGSHMVFLDDVSLVRAPKASFTSFSSCANPRSVAFNGTATFCDGTPVSGAIYTWHFGDGQTSSLQNPTHVYTNSGNYTVTLAVYYNGKHYFYEQQISVVGGSPAINSSLLSLCDAENSGGKFSVLAPKPGHVYSWTFTANVGTFTTSPAFTADNSLNSAITITNWNSFLALLDNQQLSQNAVPTMTICVTDVTCGGASCITISGCCKRGNPPSDGTSLVIDLKNVTLVPTGTAGATPWPTSPATLTGNVAVPSGGNIIGGHINIFGTLNINTNAGFDGVWVKANENAKINIPTSKLVTIQNADLRGCVHMWAGITNNGELTVLNSQISDAREAIYTGANALSKIKVINSIFNKNQTGIKLDNMPTTTSSFYLKGVVFTSRSLSQGVFGTAATQLGPTLEFNLSQNIKGSVIMGIPVNQQRASYGLFVNGIPTNRTINIGQMTSASETNFFDNQEVAGVYLRSSNATIVNNVFKNGNSTNLNNGNGVLIDNPTTFKPNVTVGFNYGYYNPISNTFQSLNNGIAATSACRLLVFANQFTGITGKGISLTKWYAAQPAQKYVSINYNGFNNCRQDVYAFDNASINANILDNRSIQTIVYPTSHSVFINELNKPIAAVYNVSNNIFSGKLNGIYCKNVYGVSINNNTVTINYPSTYAGINAGVWFDNTDRSKVSKNTIDVSPSNAGNLATAGIYTKVGIDNLYMCNNIKRAGASMRFDGACPSKIYKNDFNSLPSNPSLVGIFVNYGYTGPIGVPTSNPFGPKGFMACAENVFGDFTWGDTYCLNGSVGAAIHYPGFANAANPFYPITNLLGNPPYSPSYSNVTGQVFCPGGSSTPAEASSYSPASASFFIPSHDFGDYTSYTNHIARKSIYEMIRKEGVLEEQLEGSEPFRIEMDATPANSFYKIDEKVYDYIYNLNNSALTEAINENANIISENPIDQNQKMFNTLFFEYLALRADTIIVDTLYDPSIIGSDTINIDTILTKTSGDLPRLSEASLDQLRILASKCPITEGSSIYQARTLLSFFDDADYTNACENNIPNSPPLEMVSAGVKPNLENTTSPIGMVYSNPATNEIFVNTPTEGTQLVIYTLLGQVVLRENVNGSQWIQLANLANGLYIYKIMHGDKVLESDKITIIK